MAYFIAQQDVNLREIATHTTGRFSHLYGKSYKQLKQECLRKGQLFNDPDFPANSTSLGLLGDEYCISWRRPKEICRNAKFMADGISRFDVKQGGLGDCWVAAGLVALCNNESLMHQVVPSDQSMEEDYAGIFHFFFWHYGTWIEVIIDDRLPTRCGQVAFISSTDSTEFWSALLEKAYAKLHGSYGALEGGYAGDAMEDFTGGLCELFKLRHNAPPDLDVIINKALARNSLLACNIEATKASDMEDQLPNGLIQGHTYTVNMIKTVNLTTRNKVTLVRLRNPWGNDKEWKLAWSDRSREWSFVTTWDRKEMEFAKSADGEFWMSFEDFKNSFDKLEICNLGPDSLREDLAEETSKRWSVIQHSGEWKKNVTAGGCLNYRDSSFILNPQFLLDVESPDEDSVTSTVVVALMQKPQFAIKNRTSKYVAIGFAIYKLSGNGKEPVDKKYLCSHQPNFVSEFINLREVAHRYKLSPGRYCIIPSTFHPDVEREFILRLYAEQKFPCVELDEKTSMIEEPEIPGENIDDENSESGSSSQQNGSRNKDESSCIADSFSKLRELLLKEDEDMKITGGKEEAISILVDSLKRSLQLPLEKKRVIAAFGMLSDDNLELDAYILSDIISQAYHQDFGFERFNVDICRSMVALLDNDRSGKMNFSEFKKLWQSLKQWVKTFREYDTEKEGYIKSYQLREMFRILGYTLSSQTFQTLIMRYGDLDGRFFFQDFIHCVIRLGTMFEVYDECGLGGTIELNLDQFIQVTMYN